MEHAPLLIKGGISAHKQVALKRVPLQKLQMLPLTGPVSSPSLDLAQADVEHQIKVPYVEKNADYVNNL